MSDGYLTDTSYLATFIPEITPAWLDRCALTQGCMPPRTGSDGAFRYCELGCGFGVTTNILAATCPAGDFLGIDALPAHTEAATEFACNSGIGNSHFQALLFEDALRESYQPFDYIVAHGVYSWVNRANQTHLLDFVQRHLKPGGLFYVSYNAMPGWNDWVPIQKLLLSEAAKVDGNPETRFQQAVATIHAMYEAEAHFLKDNAALEVFLEHVKTRPVDYLLHEYLGTSWKPCYSQDVISDLQQRGLTFVGSAMQSQQREDFILRKSQRALLATEDDVAGRELKRDIFLNTNFRKDLYANMPDRLENEQLFLARANQHYALNPAADSDKLSRKTPAGTLRFDNLAAREFLQGLSDGPASPADLAKHCPDATLADFVNTVDALWAADIIRPVDPKIEGLSLDGINQTLRKMTETHQISRLSAIPYGTALPAAPCT